MICAKGNKRVVDLCIEFDELFPTLKDPDVNQALHTKLYEDLYLIYYSLMRARGGFQRHEDYYGYADYAATTIYLRFLKKLNNGEPVSSVLNYAKSTLNPLKVAYQNENFHEVINPDANPETDISGFAQRMRDAIQSDYCFGLEEDMLDAFSRLPKIVKAVVDHSPYGNDPLLNLKLYNSCLLSLIKSFTLSNSILRKIQAKGVAKKDQEDFIIRKAYEKDRITSATCWHLPEEYKSYIQLLTNKVRVIFAKEVEEVKRSFDLDENVLDSIMTSAYALSENDNEEY